MNTFPYTVKKGDTMWLIAKKFGVSLDSLIAKNHQIKDPDKIEVGWIVNVPVKGEEGKSMSMPYETYPMQSGCMDYVVKAGETLWLIAKKFGISLEELIKANSQIPDPNKIDIGQHICIPQKKVYPPQMPHMYPMKPMMPHMPQMHMPPMQMPCDIKVQHMHYLCGCCAPEMMPMHHMMPMHMMMEGMKMPMMEGMKMPMEGMHMPMMEGMHMPMMPMHMMPHCMPEMMHMHCMPYKMEESEGKKHHNKHCEHSD